MKRATVLADEAGRVLDELPSPRTRSGGLIMRPRTCREAVITPRHNQDVVIDPAGVAYSVRVHLAQHLHVKQRVEKLEAIIGGEGCFSFPLIAALSPEV